MHTSSHRSRDSTLTFSRQHARVDPHAFADRQYRQETRLHLRLVDWPADKASKCRQYQECQAKGEDALTQAIITLASEYGRYGYPRQVGLS
jgi:hypothetical protein